MEVASAFEKMKMKLRIPFSKLKELFFIKNEASEKTDINFKSFRSLGLIAIVIFIGVIFLLPADIPVEFTEKIERPATEASAEADPASQGRKGPTAEKLWGSPSSLPQAHGSSQVNYNTSMVITGGANAKTQLRAGVRLPLRLSDKVIVSQDAVPVLAELILDSQSDSGLRLPAGTRFYGEASFQKGSERATVRFTQISLPSGEIRKISSMALDKDGQPGIAGRIFSDGMKNTAGQVLSTFVGGLASGSMETDILGRSKGGIENGLLGAVSATAQSRAQAYGEKLKTEREWMELGAGTECDAILNNSLNLQKGGEQYE